MKVFISQSNYIPWKGFFDAIQLADVYVLYDEMQYTKGDWRNRNRIKTLNGLQWLTIPVKVKGKLYQKINETEISNEGWARKHWKSIVQNYQKAPCFEEFGPRFEKLYQSVPGPLLSHINYHFLNGISEMLGITTAFRWSSEFELIGDKNERLLHICQDLNADEYISGPAAQSYLDERLFVQNRIKVTWMDYSGYPEYPQLYGNFEHGVSVIDLVFNLGGAAASYMKGF